MRLCMPVTASALNPDAVALIARSVSHSRYLAGEVDEAGTAVIGGVWVHHRFIRVMRERAKALWAVARRAHSSHVAQVLARGLLCAHARAKERVYAPGGIGYVHARDEFEERARKLQRV